MIIGNKYRISAFQLLLCTVPVLWLWFVLVNHLRVEWTLNPQYGYGWAVPFLSIFMLWKRLQLPPPPARRMAWQRWLFSDRFLLVAFGTLALAYFPTRMIQEANPDWRLVSWGLAVEVVGITLCLLQLVFNEAGTENSARDFAFPILFFFVAVPWSTVVESPVIQTFTRMDVAASTELLGLFGVPAIPHGNVIEVATGVVGIDEACSGIRSFQATLMVSLFLGEWLRLAVRQRLVLVLAGFAFSLLFNFVRLVTLVMVASHRGIAAVSRWHDPTGVTILLGCLFGLWFLAHWFARKNPPAATAAARPVKARFPVTDTPFPNYVFFVLAFWLMLAEISIRSWYRYHESRLPAPVVWTVNWPVIPTMREVPIAPETRQILRYDEGESRKWETDNHSWQAVFLRWNPGSVATRLTYNHTPEVCLKAAGHNVLEQSDPMEITAHGLVFSFRFYRLAEGGQSAFVGYSLWDDRLDSQVVNTASLGWGNRLGPVLEGRRNTGQRSIELILTGVNDFEGARDAVAKLLNEIVTTGQ
jgi:exosortase